VTRAPQLAGHLGAARAGRGGASPPAAEGEALSLHDRYVRLVGRKTENLLAALALAAVLMESRYD
jgi:hypothetical protein